MAGSTEVRLSTCNVVETFVRSRRLFGVHGQWWFRRTQPVRSSLFPRSNRVKLKFYAVIDVLVLCVAQDEPIGAV